MVVRKMIIPISLTFVMVGGWACGSKGGGGGSPIADVIETVQEDQAIDRDIVLQGALNLLGSSASASLSLAADDYDIYCVTFEDAPSACRAEILAGEFNQTCVDYAGKAFGCFLRQDNRTVGDIVFDTGDSGDKDSQLVAGAGTLKVAINFDAETGMASAKVDTAASTALSTEKLDEVKAALGVSTTTVPTLTGTWTMTCTGLEDDEGTVHDCSMMDEGGEDDKEMPSSLYFHEFEHAGKRKASIWESEAAYNQCIAGGDELHPAFGATVGSNPKRVFDLTNLNAFDASFMRLIADFAISYPGEFATVLDATKTGWEAQRCVEMAQTETQVQDAFSSTTCRLLSPPVHEVEFWDDKLGQVVTRWEPDWFESWDDVASEANVDNAAIQSRSQSCFNPEVSEPRNDMPPCPWEVTHPDGIASTEATLTFTEYYVVNGEMHQPLQFVCKNPMANDTSSHDSLNFFPMQQQGEYASYLDASIAGVNAGGSNLGQRDPMCEMVELPTALGVDASALDASIRTASIYKAQKKELRQTFMDLFRSASKGGDANECGRWSVPDNATAASFNFATECADQDGGPAHAMCWQKDWVLGSLGIRVATSGTAFEFPQVGDNINSHMPNEIWEDICPTVVKPGDVDFSTTYCGGGDCTDLDFKEAVIACRADFQIAGSYAAQVIRLAEASVQHIPAATVLTCSENTDLASAIGTLTDTSCFPGVDVQMRCDSGPCIETMRCWGTPDGKCSDADGNYLGQIPSRFEVTTVKPRLAGAFELSSVTQESWNHWQEGQEIKCKAVRGFTMQSLATDNDNLEARLQFKQVEKCDNDTEVRDNFEPSIHVGLSRQ